MKQPIYFLLFFNFGLCCTTSNKVEEFSKTGQKIEYYIENGIKEGIEKRFWPSGAVECTRVYKNGKLNGEEVFYYENGNPQQKSYYVNDSLHDLLTSFYPNGNVRFECNYIKGLRNGWATAYDENGLKYQEIEYVRVRDTCFINRQLVYENGEKLDPNKSLFYTVFLENDSIIDGDSLKIHIVFNRPYELDSSFLQTGINNKYFETDHSKYYPTYNSRSDTLSIKIGDYSIGENEFIAITWDYVKGKFQQSGNPVYENFFIKKKYWVLPQLSVE